MHLLFEFKSWFLPFLPQTCRSSKINLFYKSSPFSPQSMPDGKSFTTIGQRVSHQTTMNAKAVRMSPKGEKTGPFAASDSGEHQGRQAGGLKSPWQWGLNTILVGHPSPAPWPSVLGAGNLPRPLLEMNWAVLLIFSFAQRLPPLLRVSKIINRRGNKERAGTDHQRSWRKGWPGQVPGMSQAKSFLYPGASPLRSPQSPLLNPLQTAVRAKSKPVPFIMDLGINEDCS